MRSRTRRTAAPVSPWRTPSRCRCGLQPWCHGCSTTGVTRHGVFFRAVAGPGGRTYHQAMTDTSARSGRNRGRGVSVVLGIILLVLAVVAVLAGRGTITIPGFGQDDNAAAHLSDQSDLTTVQAVIGSEKKAFFDDPGVRD